MGDISPFKALLKQRFRISLKGTHARFGSQCAEPFKSVLIGGLEIRGGQGTIGLRLLSGDKVKSRSPLRNDRADLE